MKTPSAFHWGQFSILLLIALICVGTAYLSVASVVTELERQNAADGLIIATIVASGSTQELLPDGNLATLQSSLEQYVQLKNIQYLYVANQAGEIVAHTFVPRIPPQILASDLTQTGALERNLGVRGKISEVSVPILLGLAGTLHVGLDKSAIKLQLQQTVGREIYLISAIFIISVTLVWHIFRRAGHGLDKLAGYAAHRLAPGATDGRDAGEIQSLLVRDDQLGKLARLIHALGNRADGKDRTEPPQGTGS